MIKPRSATSTGRPVDMLGKRFSRLVVERRNGSTPKKEFRWLCKCDCGNETTATGGELRRGNVQSCGCLSRDVHTTHGHNKRGERSRTYSIWSAMKTRATNLNIPSAKDYSLRGIGICARWKDYANFLADMGEAPDGMSIDRINPDLGYSPQNCRWATASEQAQNTRASKLDAASVRSIRNLASEGVPRRTLAFYYGVTDKMIGRVIRGDSWGNV